MEEIAMETFSSNADELSRAVDNSTHNPILPKEKLESKPPSTAKSSSAKSTNNDSNSALTAGIVGGQAVSSAFNMTSNLVGQSMKDQTDLAMNSANHAQRTAEQVSNQGFQQSMLAQQFSDTSALSNQNFNQNIALQNNQSSNAMTNYQTVLSGKESAMTAAGLPSYMAYSGGMGGGAPMPTPHTTQMLNGKNTYTSVLPGNPQSSAFVPTGTQQMMGWGNIQSVALPPPN